jgi:hypothetical protein
MELRIRIPDSFSSLRYMIQNPKSFLIGKYGFAEFIEEQNRSMKLLAEKNKFEIKYRQTVADLIEVRKELSILKRSKDTN